MKAFIEQVNDENGNLKGNLYIESDGIEFTIKRYGEPYISTKGEEVTPCSTLGHFNSIESACKHLVKMKLMESNATDLKTLLSEVEGIKRFIEDRVSV